MAQKVLSPSDYYYSGFLHLAIHRFLTVEQLLEQGHPVLIVLYLLYIEVSLVFLLIVDFESKAMSFRKLVTLLPLQGFAQLADCHALQSF